jgi:hypothetical protein
MGYSKEHTRLDGVLERNQELHESVDNMRRACEALLQRMSVMIGNSILFDPNLESTELFRPGEYHFIVPNWLHLLNEEGELIAARRHLFFDGSH